MSKLASLAVVISYLTIFVSDHLSARDDGRFANSPLKEWFNHLGSRNGLCCTFADGVSLRMSTGTHRMIIIVYEFTDNGL